MGLHLQMQTDLKEGAPFTGSKNLASIAGSERMASKVSPSIINMQLRDLVSSYFKFSYNRILLSLISFSSRILWRLVLKPAEIAIHLAVSILSPVSIHICIPAFLSVSTVYITSS